MATTKNHKVMHAIYCPTIRNLVKNAIELDIPRNDVVAIMKEREMFVLIYYYGKDTNE